MHDPQYIDNEEKAMQAIEAWQSEPVRAQQRYVQMAIEALELNQMYYEQKGSEKGVLRMSRCLVLLRQRREELRTA